MARHVDDVVGARHDPEVAVLVEVARVGGLVVAREAPQVGRLEALVVLPQRAQAARRQGQLDRDVAGFAGRELGPLLVEHPHVVAGNGLGGRAVLHGQRRQSETVGGDGPAGLGLPPVVDHRHRKRALAPRHGVRVRALAGEEEGAQALQVVAPEQRRARVLALDGAQRGGRGEQGVDPVLLDHTPEGARVRRPDRLALVEDRGAAEQQRRVHDVGVAHDPADVRGGPEDVPGLHAVDVPQAPLEGDGVAAVVAHDALGGAGRPRRVEDVERVLRVHRHAGGGRSVRGERRPVAGAPGLEVRPRLLPL